MPKSRNKFRNQITLAVVDPRARYSASVELREMVVCFFDFHDIKASPKKIQKPVTERRVSKQPAQSE